MPDAKPLTREERDRLEALATAATQWPTHYSPGDRSYGEEEQFLIICDDDARELPVIFVQAGDHEGEPPEAFPRAVGIANYINAATPSAVLSLLATVRAAEARVGKLREALLEIISSPDASRGPDYGCLNLHEARYIATEALAALDADKSQASGDYSVTRTPESAVTE